ncbi:hypothetical protein LHYA1_G008094, partial [Lachnellula hyalina]
MAPNWRHALRLSSDTWDPSHRFQTSWLLTPWVLFAVRAVFALYAFATLFFIIGWQASGHDGHDIHDVHKSFSYFTVLCYWAQAIYFLLASVNTFTYAHPSTPTLLPRFPPLFRALYALLYTTVTTFPFLVSLAFWSVLYPSIPSPTFNTPFSLYTNTSQHALNALFALFETLATRSAPAPWIHLLWSLMLLAMYCGLAYVTYAVKGYYVYVFLDPRPRLDVEGVNVGGVGK